MEGGAVWFMFLNRSYDNFNLIWFFFGLILLLLEDIYIIPGKFSRHTIKAISCLLDL